MVCGDTELMLFMLGLDMPKPGPILSDQCLMFANLFMASVVDVVERLSKKSRLLSCAALNVWPQEHEHQHSPLSIW